MKRFCLIFAFFCFISFLQAIDYRDSPESIFKKPTGNYSIGTEKMFLVDSSRAEIFSRKKEFREIYVKIWYPVKTVNKTKYEKYLQDYPDKVIADIFKRNGINLELIGKLKKMNTFSSPNLPIENFSEKFPLILFNPGFYFGMSDFYTSLIENLVSHGYVVCCINHPFEQPYVELPSGGVLLAKKKAQLGYLQLYLANKFGDKNRDSKEKIEKITKYYLKRLSILDKAARRWAVDTQYFIQYMTKMNAQDSVSIFSIMDLNKMGAWGQSLGGAVSGHLCVENKNIKAGINMDCFQFGEVINEPLEVPFMLMQKLEHYLDWNIGNTVIFEKSKSDFYTLTMKKARHFVFSDASMIDFVDGADKTKLIGDVDGYKSLNLINKYILDFFNKYLLNIDSGNLKEEINNNTLMFTKSNK